MAANSYRNVFLTNLDGIITGGQTSLDLGVGELGVFDAKTDLSTTSPAFPTTRAIQILLGTTDRKLSKGMFMDNKTERSPVINASRDIKFTGIKGQKPQNMIVTLGYDGVDTSKTMAPRTGKNVRLYVTLTGQPIDNLLGGTGNHPGGITETFDLVLPCVDECVDSCDTNVDCNAVTDAIIDELNKRKVIGAIPLVAQDGELGLIKVTKLTSCETPSGLPTVSCNKWDLVVADLGDDTALGAVEAQFPGYTITRVARNGIYSTYETVLCDGSTPAVFEDQVGIVIPDCTTCPSGYSLVAEYNVFTIGRTDAGTAANLTTVVADYGGLTPAGSVIRLSYSDGFSTYQIYSTSALAAIQTRATAVGKGDQVAQSGTVQSVCTLNGTGLTTAWTDVGDCQKATKDYRITLKNPLCGGTNLATLQAEYTDIGTVTLVSNNTDNCTSLYNINIQSNESCVECGSQLFTFTKPWDFNGTSWTAFSTDPVGTDCVCGIRFESAYVARDRKECFFEDVSYEVEPLFLWVSTQNPDFRDYSTLCNDDEVFPVTLVQQAQYRQGYGSQVADWVKLSNFYFNKPWYSEPVVRDAIGYELGVDLNGYYDQYNLQFSTPKDGATDFSGFGQSQYDYYEFAILVPQGTGAAFQNAINAFLSSVGAETFTL